MKVFAISDQHYGHQNIIKYCNRKHPTFQEDAEFMIAQHNKIVTENDLVVFVGDVSASFQGTQILPDVLKRLNGKKILVRGNHDHRTNEEYKRMGFLEVYNTLYWDKYGYAFHHYPDNPEVLNECSNRNLTLVCGHTHKPFNFSDNFKRINACVDVNNAEPIFLFEV